jgi:protein-S-isoprenylcysteine O-methyltransferase Ste14
MFAWGGAGLFAFALGYFLYTYVFTFAETSGDTSRVDDGAWWRAVGWDAALFSLFAIHHSAFARQPVRAWMAAHVPPRLERSTYVWVASLLLIAVCQLWQPVDGVAWSVPGPWRWITWVVLIAGIWLTLRSAGIIDIWELAGTRQSSTPNYQLPTTKHSQLQTPKGPKRTEQREPTEATHPDDSDASWKLGIGGARALEVGSWGLRPRPVEFKAEGPYGWVRHPIYLGWFLIVFSPSTMTMTRLVFAVVSCAYVVIAIPLEERTLTETAGDAYRHYMRRVRWKLVPGIY